MTLIDAHLPRFDFRERHSVAVHAPREVVLAAAERYRPEDDAFFRRMIGLREAPMRVWSRLTGRTAALPAPFGFDNFRLLEREAGREVVFGLIGRFWEKDYGLVPVADSAAFRAFDEAGVAKLVLGHAATQREDGTTLLVTETRVFCPDRRTRLKFAPYWYLIRPVSGLIRRRMLASVRRDAERTIFVPPVAPSV